jgi:hypothetical protein
MPNAGRRLRRCFVRRPIAEHIRFKDDDVGIRSYRERALAHGTAGGSRKHAGRE